jgi:hypothetical protein
MECHKARTYCKDTVFGTDATVLYVGSGTLSLALAGDQTGKARAGLLGGDLKGWGAMRFDRIARCTYKVHVQCMQSFRHREMLTLVDCRWVTTLSIWGIAQFGIQVLRMYVAWRGGPRVAERLILPILCNLAESRMEMSGARTNISRRASRYCSIRGP